ncbi:MAG TPA: DUF6159 family protein [Anaerolinea sp.]|nr:DUF6159 family protein [Anaerolinea sp.]
MNRLSNSWQMFKASLSVLAADKELMIFPILSSIGLLLVTLAFALPLFFGNLADSALFGNIGPFGFVILFLFYVVQYTVIFFANTALVGAALIRLRGGDPTVSDGFAIAGRHFGPILGYAVIAATVGVILQSLSRRSNGLGRLIISLVGMAWNVATFLVVPILAVEDVGPIEAVKRSAGYLKRTWGEQIVGNIGLGLFFGLATVLLFIVFIPLVMLILSAQTVNFWLLGGLVILFVILLSVLGLVRSTVDGIYAAAVYQYAVEGQASGFFDEDLVRNAFRQR